MDIPSKNNNQSSVHDTFSHIKVSNQLFNSDTVNDHESTNNKESSIILTTFLGQICVTR